MIIPLLYIHKNVCADPVFIPSALTAAAGRHLRYYTMMVKWSKALQADYVPAPSAGFPCLLS
jgi:hypothetical protein